MQSECPEAAFPFGPTRALLVLRPEWSGPNQGGQHGQEQEDRSRRAGGCVHSLRHSFATLLSRGGVTPRVAQAALRHSTIDLTMQVYTDPRLLDVAAALDALPALSVKTTSATGT